MTRDEIIKYYTQVLDHRKKYIAKNMADGEVLGDDSMIDLLGSVLRELKQPKPDAETGLMPCGCGGKAEIRKWEWSNDTYIAGCTVCDANVDFPYNIDETDKIISDWNRAMGRRTEE